MSGQRASISIIGCGYVGLPLARLMIRDGWLVRGSTTTEAKLPALRLAGIDAHHFVASSGLESASARLLGSDVVVVNIPPGRGDAARLARYADDVRRLVASLPDSAYVVFASSTSVYPDLSRVVDVDDASPDAGGSAEALLGAEEAVRSHAGGWAIVRFGGMYGYERRPGHFFAGRANIPGGASPVNMIHRDDAVDLVRALAMQPPPGAVVNGCAPGHPTRAAFYECWARRAGLEPPVFGCDPVPFKIVAATILPGLGFTYAHPDPMMPAP